jgi:hypothetical protein
MATKKEKELQASWEQADKWLRELENQMVDRRSRDYKEAVRACSLALKAINDYVTDHPSVRDAVALIAKYEIEMGDFYGDSTEWISSTIGCVVGSWLEERRTKTIQQFFEELIPGTIDLGENDVYENSPGANNIDFDDWRPDKREQLTALWLRKMKAENWQECTKAELKEIEKEFQAEKEIIRKTRAGDIFILPKLLGGLE